MSAVTSFVGREAEIAELERLVAEARLVTLTGPGGVGKTRLAVQVAQEIAPTFPDGVLTVELDSARTARDVSRRVDAALARVRRDGGALLVVDTCDHVLGACARHIEHVLTTRPALHVLATSREPLGIVGERRWPVAAAADSAAIDSLWLVRTHDGVSQRHQSLVANVGWSLALLSTSEHVLLERLTIFEGWFTLQVVERVCTDHRVPVGDVLDLVRSLVDRSLVIADVRLAATRYRVPAGVRDCVLVDPATASELSIVRARHLEWSFEVAHEAEGAQPAPSPVPVIARRPAAALSRREAEVAELIVRGLTNRAIAQALAISPGTVRVHVEHVLRKLGIRSRAQVGARLAARRASGSLRLD